MKLGEATGAYTQMLEGCGLSVEDFNEGLAACKTEAEKQAYMLKVTEGALGAAGEKYKEVNGEVIRANQANDAWMQSMAGVGGAIEPIVTDVKMMGAALLAEAVPGVQKLAEAFRGLMNGEDGAAGNFASALSGLVTGLVSKITEALPAVAEVGLSIITTLATSLAQQLPTLLTTGGQIVAQLLSGIAANLPNIVQSALSAIGNLVSGLQTGLPLVLQKGREILLNLATGIKENLPSLVSQALDILMNFATTIYDNAPTLIKTGFDVLSNLVQGILNSLPVLLSKAPEIISKFANVINDNFPTILKKGFDLLVQIVKGLISAIPTLVKNIPKIIRAIVDVFTAFNWLNLGKNIITFLKKGITSMVGAVKGAGKNVLDAIVNAIKSLPTKLLNLGKTALTSLKKAITSARGAVASAGGNILNAVVNAIKSMPSKLLTLGRNAISKLGSAISSGVSTLRSKATSVVNSVVNTVKTLPSKMLSIGRDLITGLWNGISDKFSWLIGKIKSFAKSVLGSIKDFFGVNSPSRETAWIGDMLDQGLAEGMLDNASTPVNAMRKVTGSVLDAAQDINGLQVERGLQYRTAATQAAAAGPAGLSDKLDAILAAIERGQVLTIDGRKLVGGTAAMYDTTLGQRRTLAARGAL